MQDPPVTPRSGERKSAIEIAETPSLDAFRGEKPVSYGDESQRRRLLRAVSIRNISLIYVGVAFIIIFAIWVPSTFLTQSTLQTVLYDNSTTALLAVGLVFPFAAGAFDISVGATVGFSAVILGDLATIHHMAWPLASLVAILGGAGVGAVNGLLVVKLRIDSIIATLAMMSVLTGLGEAIGNNGTFIAFPASFTNLGADSFFGLTLQVWALLIVAVVMYYVLDWTAIGRSIYATGGNAEAARLAGVRINRNLFWTLVVSGTVAGLAGVLLTARLGSSEADLGPPYLLPAVAALFLGGTQFNNRFNVWGTVAAAYVLAIGVQGLTLAGISTWLPNVFDGVALAIAVAMTVRRRKIRLPLRRLRSAAPPADSPSATIPQMREGSA